MSHTTLKVKAGNDAWRDMPDTEKTYGYIVKLSHAAVVYVVFDSGEGWSVDCGVINGAVTAASVIPLAHLLELVAAGDATFTAE